MATKQPKLGPNEIRAFQAKAIIKGTDCSPDRIRRFRAQIWAFYRHSGRKLPWRNTRNPYRILVSEVMLQQTQVARVLEKYSEFLEAFPTIQKLANSSLADVLHVWQGMGYNRRARYLRDAAQMILREHSGHIPKTEQELFALPGVGHYTANAILTFAHNDPRVFIETNIRRVFINHFFQRVKNVSDREIFLLVGQTVDRKNPREWYYALMDYGSHLPKILQKNSNVQSKHYVKQSAFKGSLRELRGKIIAELSRKPRTLQSLGRVCANDSRTQEALDALLKDRLIKHLGRPGSSRYWLA